MGAPGVINRSSLFEAGFPERIFQLLFHGTLDLLPGLPHDLIVPSTGPATGARDDVRRLGVLRHLKLVAAA